MGDKIRERRLFLRLSQAELAEKAGLSRQMISLIENGKAVNISINTMKSIASALDSSVEEIFLE